MIQKLVQMEILLTMNMHIYIYPAYCVQGLTNTTSTINNN